MDVKLVLFNRDATTRVFDLSGRVTSIGRRKECDLCIPLMVVSRRHCQLIHEDGRLKIHDLKSTNGTFVNGNRVGFDKVELAAGDRIQIGPVILIVQIDGGGVDVDILTSEPGTGQIDIETLNQGDTTVE